MKKELKSYTELTDFVNAKFGKIRTTVIDGEVWFVAKDVADALGYTNSRKALADHVEDEDKGVTKWSTVGGKQNLSVINESGLYSLIFGSKLPTAREFKRWVTTEVLPAIRRNGMYISGIDGGLDGFDMDGILDDPDKIIELAKALKEDTSLDVDLSDPVFDMDLSEMDLLDLEL